MTFVFYLKAFNSDISVMIQSKGGNTLPQAFDLVVSVEINLIDAGKLSPRPLMPIFPDLSNQVVELVVPSSSASQSMYVYPDSQQASPPPPSSLAVEVRDTKNLLTSFSNEIVNPKKVSNPAS